MLIKKILLGLLFVFSVSSIYALECNFDYSQNCERTASSFNSFNLNFAPSNMIDTYSAQIYNKENPSNKLRLEIEGNVVRNINPLIEPGVYVLSIETVNKANQKNTTEFEFIFDNTVPIPPKVPIKINTTSSNVLVSGETLIGNTKVIATVGSSSFEAVSDNEGKFQLTLASLQNGINYARFYAENSQGVKSAPVERVIMSNGDFKSTGNDASNIQIASSSEISSINGRTIFSNGVFVTSKRNFYVFGTASGSRGDLIYINGQRAVFDGTRFGGFVLLNEGRNDIVVKSDNNNRREITVIFSNFNFMFEEVNFNKVVSDANVRFQGSTNFDLPFNVYLNGKYITAQTSQNGNFDFIIQNLNEGKNYISLVGHNSEILSYIVYRDVLEPVINVLTPERISEGQQFIFEATDDTGIDFTSINVRIGNLNFNPEDIEISGNFFIVNISNLATGVHSYEISLRDRSGKSSVKSGSLNVNSDNTLIENIHLEKGYNIGNKIFAAPGKQKIVIKPSRFIAFKKIYLDNVEQIDYDIKSTGEVHINLDFSNDNGILKFIFVNNQMEEFEQEFFYFSSSKRPTVELDYIERSSGIPNSFIRVTGKINSPHFDWTSLSFNNQKGFQRYGDYFEAYVQLSGSGQLRNLQISGFDYMGIPLSNSNYGSILFSDTTDTRISVMSPRVFRSGFYGTIISNDPARIKNYVSSYDGFSMPLAYMSRNAISYPVHQRDGIRALNLRGVESSLRTISSVETFTIDTIDPEIYFEVDGNRLKVIVDGTLSNVDMSNFRVEVNGVEFSYNSCSNYIKRGIFDMCIQLNPQSGDVINIYAKDIAGNSAQRSFTFEVDQPDPPAPDPTSPDPNNTDVYIVGTDTNVTENPVIIQGNIVSDVPIADVIVSGGAGGECEFDDTSFLCIVTAVPGENNFTVEIIGDNGQTLAEDSITITYNASFDIDIRITNIEGVNLYKVGNEYYYVYGDIDISAIVSDRSAISILIDGERRLIGSREGEFNVRVNLEEHFFGKEKAEASLWLEAKDEFSNAGVSQSFKIIFNRVFETIVRIIVY